jgi:hypothetical protein
VSTTMSAILNPSSPISVVITAQQGWNTVQSSDTPHSDIIFTSLTCHTYQRSNELGEEAGLSNKCSTLAFHNIGPAVDVGAGIQCELCNAPARNDARLNQEV